MYRVLITVILTTTVVLARNVHRKRDVTSLKKQVIAKYIEHLGEVELDDPAFVQIMEVIADKANETARCGL